MTLPDEVRRLLDERSAAREERDWERADALRDEIATLGWDVQDSGGRSTARPILARDADAPDALDGEATVAASIQVVAEDYPEDLARLLRGLAAYPPSIGWELVIVSNAPAMQLDELLSTIEPPVVPVILDTAGRLGWADSRTLGMRQSHGEVTILLDTSVEPTGDVVTPLLAAFEDPSVGLAGGWGVTSGNGRQFEEAEPGEVDAVEAYCLAIRREALRAVGGFDRHFRFYRNADLDLSFAVRDAGWRAVRTAPLPLTRHEHRGWAALPEPERDRLSRAELLPLPRPLGRPTGPPAHP